MNSIIFTIFIAMVFLITVIMRLGETSWLEKRKVPGRKYATWTTFVFGVGYVLTLLGTIVEYMVVEREINLIVTLAGILLLITKMAIKYWSANTLGRFWSHQIEISKEHKLIEEGLYRYIRHPVYLSLLLGAIAIPLLANAYFMVIAALIIRFPGILIRIYIEENALIEKFGSEYVNYRNRTGALLPVVNLRSIKDNHENTTNTTTNQP